MRVQEQLEGESMATKLKTEFDVDKGIEQLVGALINPIIVWPGGELTKEQKDRVTLERLMKAADINNPEEASDYEVCLYQMTASLAGPLSHTGYKVYMHAFSKVYGEEQAKTLLPGAETTLDPQEEVEYKRFKRWLYRKQVEGRKKGAKAK